MFLENLERSMGDIDDVGGDEDTERENPKSSEKWKFVNEDEVSIREIYPEIWTDIMDSTNPLIKEGGAAFISDTFSEGFFKEKSLVRIMLDGMYKGLGSNFNLDEVADASMADTDLLFNGPLEFMHKNLQSLAMSKENLEDTQMNYDSKWFSILD